ncbi:MAG: hypothetical protein HYS87_02855 [Candidatus Colwellbacteria bacterium]|nr:hypothetical protein [Candidatus Colwellbacteria bacterium]
MKKILLLAILVVVGVVVWQFVAREDSYQKTPTSADNAPPGSIHNLPVPDAVAAVRRLAAETYNVPEGEVIVITAYEREWPNSCLGLEAGGEFCAQVITPGYEVTVKAGSQNYTYRTNSNGTAIRLAESQ